MNTNEKLTDSKSPALKREVKLASGEIVTLKPLTLKALPDHKKYRPYLEQFQVNLAQRTWPENKISAAPTWCSVDLRDGNQALINPLSIEQKLQFFQYLVAINFKEIEIGFPSASTIEFEFTRCLIDNQLIPDDVTPQVLTQARDHLIERSFEALKGCKKAIVHLYNSTSELQRRVVYEKDKKEITAIAVAAVKRIKQLAQTAEFETILEYSPESFTGTELPFAHDICRAVMDEWQPSTKNKLIFNWPATVEMTTPNIYADQIEWMCQQFAAEKESLIFSVHPHNDRGTGIAAAELALLAGANRVEGTLFGNGERTGNVDIVTMALNLFSQGIDPQLVLGDIPGLAEVAGHLTELPVHERHPYAGKLVFTAFSGSHQDAIRKGLSAVKSSTVTHWQVPYLAIDPADIGRAYEPLVRINSQSGKGGVAFILETNFGYLLPKKMHPEVSAIVQSLSERTGREVLSQDVFQAFSEAFLAQKDCCYRLLNFSSSLIEGESASDESNSVECQLQIMLADGTEKRFSGSGNGPIDACRDALIRFGAPYFKLRDYSEHALGEGSNAQAAAYVQVELEGGKTAWGAGQHPNTTKAAVAAMLSALNRALAHA
jgi:2-isopropylmalate synthase